MSACRNPTADVEAPNGDARIYNVTVFDSEDEPIDLTPFVGITYRLVECIDDEVDLISKSLGSGITKLPFDATDNPNLNKYTIQIDSTDTVDLSGDYYHESKLVDGVGNLTTTFKSENVNYCK